MESRETREQASEVKFLVDAATAADIERWARNSMAPDPHGEVYEVTSLYFDTPDRDVYERRGSFGRGKYRIRRYNHAGHVFLERKLRADSMVAKRRSIVPVEDLALLESQEVDPGWKPGFWFHRRLRKRGLQPAWQISYTRMASVLDTATGPIRLTLDRDLAAQQLSSISFQSGFGAPVFEDRSCILEMKFRRHMPELFAGLVSELGLTRQPVSKFRLAAGALAFV